VVLNLLEPLGFSVVLATNGQEAIAKAEEHPPDLLLIDLAMSGMNGFETIRALRSIPGLQHVPGIAVSASVYESDQERSRLAGFAGFLPKPIDSVRLWAIVGEVLELEWIYSEVPAPVEANNLADERSISQGDYAIYHEMIYPPLAELERLYELARFGSMRRINERATQLAALDASYEPFANRLRDLAERVEEDELMTLLTYYLYIARSKVNGSH
jgi:CheY-like chemotaxis protein